MPNYGRSGRCHMCKRRHVKCDEARPICSPCRRLGLECGGYNKQYIFRDESHKFASAASPKTELGRSLLTATDVAVPFFLEHYASTGRRLAAAPGFFETLIPMYISQPQASPLSLAVSALAARVFCLWRPDDTAYTEPSLAPYNRAVNSLRLALEHPQDRHRSATALAILALYFCETLSATYNARQAVPVHHHGALSLLPAEALDGRDDIDGLISTYVKGFVLHTEISSALRQKRSMHPNAYAYVESPHALTLVPGNPSSTLDSIGASVAEIQADYMRGISQRYIHGPLPEQQCRAWYTEATQIDELLLAWARDMHDYWRPLRLTSGQDFSPSIAAYQSACDIYPSCQIATLWNLWRFHRLLLLKVTLGATRMSTWPWDESADDGRLVPGSMVSAIQADSIQELVDSICYNVSFYLGNRAERSSLNDFTDARILFPSCHSLEPGDVRVSAWHDNSPDPELSADEHQRHILAYGAWHIMSPLSNLLTRFSDDHGGRLVASFLRPGQQEWIRQQFLRVGTLIRLPAAAPLDGHQIRSLPPSRLNQEPSESAVESLAKQARSGAMFMSGS